MKVMIYLTAFFGTLSLYALTSVNESVGYSDANRCEAAATLSSETQESATENLTSTATLNETIIAEASTTEQSVNNTGEDTEQEAPANTGKQPVKPPAKKKPNSGEEESESWLGLLLKSHKLPSLHFQDILEFFYRR
ncbi:MAG: hypothetical protein V2I33_03240 [Kangiellaceae bacterium]|jgi:hypothetical protein|nr:hypothetical protein [Kangiellaceae bacterium]